MSKDVQVISRISAVLDALGQRQSASLKEVSLATGLAMSTASRLLGSLAREGFVERDQMTKCYLLGRRFLSFVASARPRHDIASVLHPILQKLCDDTGEDAGLAELQGLQAVFVDRVDSSHALRIINILNQPQALYCGAFRKVLLAFQPDDWIADYVQKVEFVQYTGTTICSPEPLWEEIRRIRGERFARSFGERLPDAAGIAAPVFDHTGEIRAALHVAGPMARINEGSASGYVGAVVEAAATATRILSGRPPSSGKAEGLSPEKAERPQ